MLWHGLPHRIVSGKAVDPSRQVFIHSIKKTSMPETLAMVPVTSPNNIAQQYYVEASAA